MRLQLWHEFIVEFFEFSRHVDPEFLHHNNGPNQRMVDEFCIHLRVTVIYSML